MGCRIQGIVREENYQILNPKSKILVGGRPMCLPDCRDKACLVSTDGTMYFVWLPFRDKACLVSTDGTMYFAKRRK